MLRIHYAIEHKKKQDFFYKNKENIKYLTILLVDDIILKSEEKESRVSTLTLAQRRD